MGFCVVVVADVLHLPCSVLLYVTAVSTADGEEPF